MYSKIMSLKAAEYEKWQALQACLIIDLQAYGQGISHLHNSWRSNYRHDDGGQM